MTNKTKELAAAGHALAKELHCAESAALVRELATQLDVQLSRGNALAAENAGLKAALRPSYIPSELTDAFGDTAVIEHDSTGDNQGHSVSWSWVGNQEEVIKSVLLAVDKGIETPATDAFLAEVRASALEYYANLFKDTVNMDVKHNQEFHKGTLYVADQFRKGASQ